MTRPFINPVIVATLCRRPNYTKRLFDALAACYGFERFKLVLSVDIDERHPRESQQVLDMCYSFKYDYDHEFTETLSNRPRLGIDEHKLQVMEMAFIETDFCIFLEDDIIPTRDFLRYMEWASYKFRDDWSVLSVSGYNQTPQGEKRAYTAFRDRHFNCWGWGMWIDRWEQYFADGEKAYREYAGVLVNGLFDRYLRDMAIRDHLDTIFPCVARTQNIGIEMGEHTIPDVFLQTDYNPNGAWQWDRVPDVLPDRWTLEGYEVVEEG